MVTHVEALKAASKTHKKLELVMSLDLASAVEAKAKSEYLSVSAYLRRLAAKDVGDSVKLRRGTVEAAA